MSTKSFIDSVKVGNPCTEDWQKMHGTDRVRFCDHCAKDVRNLSAVTRKEAMRLVRASGGNLCIRYIENPVTHRPFFADQLVHITRRAPGLAAGVMTASLGLSTMSYAQNNLISPTSPASTVNVEKGKTDEVEASSTSGKPATGLSGTIVDQNSAAISGAKVTIFSLNAKRTAITNDDGVYRFQNIPSGLYRIESEAPGFKTSENEVSVFDEAETVADATLGIELIASVDVISDSSIETTISVSGGIGFVEYGTPLTRAVANDDVDEVRELIAKGANVNGKDENYSKITPLFIAIENGNVEITKILLDFGAKVNARDKEKQTPLMRLDEDATPELIDLMTASGVKVNLVDSEGNTALIFAARSTKADVVQKLVDAGADVNISNNEGQTALMNAVQSENPENIRILLVAGSQVNAKNREGETAWDQATTEEIKSLLVSSGADIRERVEDIPSKTTPDN